MSTNRRIYLDYNATAPLSLAARDAMIEVMADVGNPSSIHAEGRRVRDRVERARNQVATLVGRPREQVVFTSGGTEANWLGVMALAAAVESRGLPKVIATTPIEHPSLKGPIEALRARGWQVAMLPASVEFGVIEVGDTPRAGLLAAGLVNHEIGTILGSAILAWARDIGALVHLDAVQAAGKLPLDRLPVDSIAISGHKLGAPQGVGALAISIDGGLPLVDGGHQERGRRPGTENVLGIVGFGAAAADVQARELDGARTVGGAEDGAVAIVRANGWSAVSALGDELESGVRMLPDIRVHGDAGQRVGGTINAGFAGALGEAIVMALDLEGISVSTGAACTSGSIQPSAVLLGLGYSPVQAREAVRFSLGPGTTEHEVKQVLAVLPGIVERARRHR